MNHLILSSLVLSISASHTIPRPPTTMPFLTHILGAKKAAQAHRKSSTTTDPTPLHPSTSKAQLKPGEEIPYRHVPTHALSDSLNLGAAMPTQEFQERIKRESKRYSARPQSMRRTGSETFLGEMRRQRSGANLRASVMQEGQGGMVTGDGGESLINKGKGKLTLPLPPPPRSDPYAMQSGLQSPKRAVRSPIGSAKASPVPSMRSVGNPLARSIAGKDPTPLQGLKEAILIQRQRRATRPLVRHRCAC